MGRGKRRRREVERERERVRERERERDVHLIAFLSLSAIESTPTRLDLVIAKTSSRRTDNTLKEVLVSHSARLVLQYAPS